jgi:two-component system nitrate/nitrite response regulator NarL
VAIRLVLVDDHPIVLDGLVDLFRASSDFEIVATASDGESALAAVRAHRPDVLVADVRLPGLSGLDVAGEVIRSGLLTRVVLLTAEIDDDQALQAVRLGVHGVILKQMATRLLTQCVRKVHAGGRWVEQESLRRAVENLLRKEATAPGTETPLTPTETRVVELLAGGARNKEIANRLTVSEATVKNHLHNIYVKLKLASRRELLDWYQGGVRRTGGPGPPR